MKRPTMLLEQLLVNYQLVLSLAVDRDVRVIERRYRNEGMSFLTISLPILCDALDQGLASGRLTPCMFPGFKPWKRGGNLPALFAGFYRRIFGIDGRLLAVPCIDSIRAIRQVTRLFKKVELPCSPARISRAFERYMTNEREIDGSSPNDSQLYRDVRVVAGYLWSDLESFSERLYCSPGKHGSGAVAERYGFNERHKLKQWPERGEHLFPLSVHSSHREDDTETFNGIEIVSPELEHPVRVVTVPKTLKTPRIIAVEPSYMMLRQQSIARPLMDYLEFDHSYRGSIRFRDQTPNQQFAMLGSLNGEISTIDLSDASDRVSYSLVRHILQVAPSFLAYCEGSRSTRAKLPDRPVLTLNKFASMGSAMCFPIESMVFFTIVATSMWRRSGKRLSRSRLKAITAKIAVYGDDIIVPTETAAGVMEDLEALGLKVNHDKSFTTGFFRESCGGDYYRGHDVTPAYCRQWTSSERLDPVTLSAYVSLSNQFYMKGLWHVSQYIRTWIDCNLHSEARQRRSKLLRSVRNQPRVRIPRSRYPIGVLHYASCLYTTGLHWCKALSGYRVRGPALVATRREDRAEGMAAHMLLSQQSRITSPQSRDTSNSSYRLLAEISAGGSTTNGRRSQLVEQLEQPARGRYERTHTSCLHGHDAEFLLRSGRKSNHDSFIETVDSHLQSCKSTDFLTSVRPYSLKTKNRWTPVPDNVGNWSHSRAK